MEIKSISYNSFYSKNQRLWNSSQAEIYVIGRAKIRDDEECVWQQYITSEVADDTLYQRV